MKTTNIELYKHHIHSIIGECIWGQRYQQKAYRYKHYTPL